MKTRWIACLPLAALLATGAVTGCAGSLNTPHAVVEKAEIDGELAYQGTVAALGSAMSTGKISPQEHDADWRKAWADLQAFRALYHAGRDVTGVLSTLQGDLAAAKAH